MCGNSSEKVPAKVLKGKFARKIQKGFLCETNIRSLGPGEVAHLAGNCSAPSTYVPSQPCTKLGHITRRGWSHRLVSLTWKTGKWTALGPVRYPEGTRFALKSHWSARTEAVDGSGSWYQEPAWASADAGPEQLRLGASTLRPVLGLTPGSPLQFQGFWAWERARKTQVAEKNHRHAEKRAEPSPLLRLVGVVLILVCDWRIPGPGPDRHSMASVGGAWELRERPRSR